MEGFLSVIRDDAIGEITVSIGEILLPCSHVQKRDLFTNRPLVLFVHALAIGRAHRDRIDNVRRRQARIQTHHFTTVVRDPP